MCALQRRGGGCLSRHPQNNDATNKSCAQPTARPSGCCRFPCTSRTFCRMAGLSRLLVSTVGCWPWVTTGKQSNPHTQTHPSSLPSKKQSLSTSPRVQKAAVSVHQPNKPALARLVLLSPQQKRKQHANNGRAATSQHSTCSLQTGNRPQAREWMADRQASRYVCQTWQQSKCRCADSQVFLLVPNLPNQQNSC